MPLKPEANTSLLRTIVYPFQVFERAQVRSGLLVLFVTLLALTWLNSPWGHTYLQAWHTPLTIAFGELSISKPILYWINNALMAVFFLVIGLEAKRVFRTGELATFREAAFPMAAALGGIVVPAGLYLYLNMGQPGQAGWGIPVATDVAAVLALMALVGHTVPLSLRLFLSSLAILLTLSSLLLTAIPYTTISNLLMLSVGTGIFGLLIVLRALRNRSMWLYLLLGLLMLGAFLLAGVTGAIAGVLLALVIPVSTRIAEEDFITTTDTVMGQLHALHMVRRPEPGEETEEDYQAAVHTMKVNCSRALSPLRRLLLQLLPWAVFAVLPLFVLANAPFAYNSFELKDLWGQVPMGIFLGLVVGKPIGIVLFAWLATLLGVASKPHDISWIQVAGAGLLAGTGFTMSLFIVSGVFPVSGLLPLAKISIFVASALAAVLGVLLLYLPVKK